jgi:hypothetical protein
MLFRLFLLFLFVSFNSLAQPNNILFLGNSYTHMNNLYKIYGNLANSKGKSVYTDTLAVSGSTLMQHTLRNNTYKKIQAKNWDYVFIQGFSRELSYDSLRIAKETIPYAQQLIDSIKQYNPCANIYFYMTWGYAEGFADSIPGDNYTLMQERIQRGYMQLSRATGCYPIAPVGMVWQEIRKRYPEVILYSEDKQHPSLYGSYIAACTFYSCIYKETPLNGLSPKKIEPIHALNIQQTAADYVFQNFDLYNLDTIQVPKHQKPPKIDFTITENWLNITLVNKTIGGVKYYWDFGDGNRSTKKNPKHYYTKNGKYTVTLNVLFDCHWYQLKKTVKVSKSQKNSKSPVKTKKPSKP